MKQRSDTLIGATPGATGAEAAETAPPEAPDRIREGMEVPSIAGRRFDTPPGKTIDRLLAESGLGVVAEGLDRLEVGMFRLNRQGYVVEFNDTASAILELDHAAAWEDRLFANIDRRLHSGLYEQLDAIIEGEVRYLRRDFRTRPGSGPSGRLTLCAVPLKNGGARSVAGFVYRTEAPAPRRSDRSDELRILAEVAAALSSTLELRQILRIILTGATANQGLGFNRAFLLLYDEANLKLAGHMAVGPESPEEAGHIWKRLDGLHMSLAELLDTGGPTGELTGGLADRVNGLSVDMTQDSLVARICESGAWMNLEDGGDLDEVTTGLLDRFGSRRAALVPLVSKGALQGLIVADNAITGAPVGDGAVRLLKILADQAAVAIQRARLHNTERERSRQLEQASQRLAQSQDQIVRSEKMSVMGELTAAVAQELRNPLTIAGGFLNLMAESGMSDEQREFLRIVENEVKRTDTILRHVLHFANASKETNQVFDFSVLVENVLAALAGRQGPGGEPIGLSCAVERLPVFGNRDQVARATEHLLTLVEEEVGPYGRMQARTEEKDGRARLLVSLISEVENRPRVIRVLEQLFARQTSSQRLSVLVAAETVRYHGGDCGISACDGGIPCLWMELPLAEQRGNQ